MKKTIILLLLIPQTFFCALGQTKSEERERSKIATSKVKQVTQWSHRFKQGKPETKGNKTSETKYDKRGNPIEIINYKATGEISSKALYKYNDKNQRIEYVFYQRDDDQKIVITNKQNYLYDAKGNKTLEVRYDGATQSRIVYEYHPDGRPKSIVSSSAGNKILETWEYTYAGKNQVVNVFDSKKNLLSTTKRNFDDRGNILEETRFDGKGKELKRENNSFGTGGELVNSVEHYAGNLIKKLAYKYDGQGQVSEIVQEEPDGTRFIQSLYKYDLKGNLLEERWSEGGPGEFSHKQSSYDNKGNTLEVDSYYAPYKFRVLYKYTYEYY